MYIRFHENEYQLVRIFPTPDGPPSEVVLARLGEDPDLNLFIAAGQGRRKHPELWDGVHDYHLLQALENLKRRLGGYKPALVAVQGGKVAPEEEENQTTPDD